ncbi:MAG: nitrile hydratase subunit beta [Alphaproteobacteria bacterium]|nr:MAG: nitrile hydratase subunit beta [Alphaproteobacteria bacterium]
MGGEAAGPIERTEHDYALWEKRVDALYTIASGKGIFTVDALRRVLEEMGPEAFETMSYYERWVEAINRNLIAAGVYSPAELATKMAEVEARGDEYAAASLDRSDG